MTEQGKFIERKSFIVAQSNELQSESVNRNAGPAMRPLNDTRPFTPALLSVKDESSDRVLSGVAESQIVKQPPAVIEGVKSKFSSLTPPSSDVPVVPKAIDQNVSTSPLDDTKQNSDQPPWYLPKINGSRAHGRVV